MRRKGVEQKSKFENVTFLPLKANVMVKHHAEGELPQWVFSMCSQSQISGIKPIPQRPLQLIRPITISDSLEKNQVIPDNTWSCPGIPERYPGFSRG